MPDAWNNGLEEALDRLREHSKPNPPRFDARDRAALAFVLDRLAPSPVTPDLPPICWCIRCNGKTTHPYLDPKTPFVAAPVTPREPGAWDQGAVDRARAVGGHVRWLMDNPNIASAHPSETCSLCIDARRVQPSPVSGAHPGKECEGGACCVAAPVPVETDPVKVALSIDCDAHSAAAGDYCKSEGSAAVYGDIDLICTHRIRASRQAPVPGAPRCATWCGTNEHAPNVVWFFRLPDPSRCWCSIACRDAGRPLNPKEPTS